MPEQYSILICDDHAILLEGLKVCLQRTPGVGNVLLCTTMHNAMQLLDSGGHVDLCIVDLDLPDGSGIALIEHVKRVLPEVRTMVYTSHEEIWNINAIMRSEADGVVFKSCGVEELQLAVTNIARGDNYFCKRFSAAGAAHRDAHSRLVRTPYHHGTQCAATTGARTEG